MSKLSRRSFLWAATVGIAAASGCSEFIGEGAQQNPYSVGTLVITNEDSKRRSLTITTDRRRNESVPAPEFTIGPEGSDVREWKFSVKPGEEVVYEEFLDGTDLHIIRVELDDSESEKIGYRPGGKEGEPGASLHVTITEQGDIGWRASSVD